MTLPPPPPEATPPRPRRASPRPRPTRLVETAATPRKKSDLGNVLLPALFVVGALAIARLRGVPGSSVAAGAPDDRDRDASGDPGDPGGPGAGEPAGGARAAGRAPAAGPAPTRAGHGRDVVEHLHDDRAAVRVGPPARARARPDLPRPLAGPAVQGVPGRVSRQRRRRSTAPRSPDRPWRSCGSPRLDVEQVVVEGTAPGDLFAGPGHLRSTVLPGQAGTSLVYGRAATYGGPFGRLDEPARGGPDRGHHGAGRGGLHRARPAPLR
ncbi:hypothetical protein G5V59_10155 [Nocardioides sp. W3-2-3]|uniref:hypothetical protein n=1 Tax=Nocardioides convexus TaxID=2712224 RepID=UPI002418864B|nr:hypothetical protein [Nocardioides convexus]NHA00350.1 hypothetical protein [Nocardioides convexus]